jgi:restriction system protein
MAIYRVSLGRQAAFAEQARAESWIGVDWFSGLDLTGEFPDQWRDFNKKYIPIYLDLVGEGGSRVAGGLACGMTWIVGRGIQVGDYVLSSKGDRQYQVAVVKGDYFYAQGSPLPHRRPVEWLDVTLSRDDFSEALFRATKSAGTVQNLTDFEEEIMTLIGGRTPDTVVVNEVDVENPYTFVLERYLEDFLVSNWTSTELGKDFDIFEEDGELVGQQYPSDTGPIDILAISKDKKTILVVELKRGKVSDVVVGQIQRYMGFVKEELVQPGQQVHGAIIGLDDDRRVQRALAVTQNIDFYKYEVDFRLHKA